MLFRKNTKRMVATFLVAVIASVWVDPLAGFESKLTGSDVASRDGFGFSAAISGDTAVVGTSLGAPAYVFVRSGTTWIEEAKLTASDGALRFGRTVAISGDTIVVGTGFSSPGAAYVFVRSGTIWTQEAMLTPSDAAFAFGFSVTIDGDTIVVRSLFSSFLSLDAAAYVFVRSGTTWIEGTFQSLLASSCTFSTAEPHAAEEYWGKSGTTVILSMSASQNERRVRAIDGSW